MASERRTNFMVLEFGVDFMRLSATIRASASALYFEQVAPVGKASDVVEPSSHSVKTPPPPFFIASVADPSVYSLTHSCLG